MINPLKKKPRTHFLQEAPEKPDWLKVKLTFPDPKTIQLP
ncbi:hypothetical protein LEP1GSC137_4540 [Leptospira borgpetersenii str. Noumea 25]|nr:hypothetical protein LEP1GSC137_4540 [Leptospira borgpetersenii str. Noumea 25]